MTINAVRYLQSHRGMALATGFSSAVPFGTAVPRLTSWYRQTAAGIRRDGKGVSKVSRN